MLRRIVVVGAMLLAACGSDVKSSAPDQAGLPGFTTGTIPAALSTWSGTAKIALYRTTVSAAPVMDCDEIGQNCGPLACGAGCPTGSTCRSDNICYEQVLNSSLFYLDKQPIGNAGTNIRVPCDGNKYTVELYASAQVASPFSIAEMRKTNPFTMNTDCTQDFSPATSLWLPAGTPPDPVVVVPQLFAGYTDMAYTVALQNTGYPFGASSLSVSPAQTAVTGMPMSFYEPTTTDTITFTGTFELAKSLNPGTTEVWTKKVPVDVTPTTLGGIAAP